MTKELPTRGKVHLIVTTYNIKGLLSIAVWTDSYHQNKRLLPFQDLAIYNLLL